MKALSVSLPRRAAALVAFETVLIVVAVALGAWVRLGTDAADLLLEQGGLAKALLIALVCQVSLYYADLYELRVASDRRALFIGIVRALSATSFMLAAIYFWFPDLIIGRGVFLASSILVLVFVAAWRLSFEWVTRRVAPSERLLLLGTGQAAVGLARELFERRQELGVEIVGFVDPDPARVGAPVINPGVIGTIEDIPSIVRARKVDRVVVSLAEARGKLPMDKLLEI
jgi:FlaA1/EpsC-like NDP-sugar epimerase